MCNGRDSNRASENQSEGKSLDLTDENLKTTALTNINPESMINLSGNTTTIESPTKFNTESAINATSASSNELTINLDVDTTIAPSTSLHLLPSTCPVCRLDFVSWVI